ncbi:MAG: hypothetical protein KatS3mg105_1091 [Gemmatales bacterium]|nr:MAG: hypothetical protein KatS3mg105_1091 [Gemmatales bacterium]
MPWPISQDYNEAIQNPRNSFLDADLHMATPALNALGMPMPCSGTFADVYQMQGQNGKKWAVKCFTREVPGLRDRYREISAYLKQVNLPFTVDFVFLDQGIRIKGHWYPVLKMTWVEGFNLNEFVRNCADKPKTLDLLASIWLKVSQRLRSAKIAHADLQHGNVLLVPARNNSLGVRLIDYDGMHVPALANQPSGEVGHACYQHPQRIREQTYNLEVDRFPHLVIYTALRALRVMGRDLWERFDNGDNLLFTREDFVNPDSSPLFQELLKASDRELRVLAENVKAAASGPLEKTPLLEQVVQAAQSQKAKTIVRKPVATGGKASAASTGSKRVFVAGAAAALCTVAIAIFLWSSSTTGGKTTKDEDSRQVAKNAQTTGERFGTPTKKTPAEKPTPPPSKKTVDPDGTDVSKKPIDPDSPSPSNREPEEIPPPRVVADPKQNENPPIVKKDKPDPASVVDLLANVHLEAAGVVGEWQFFDGKLVSPATNQRNRLPLPVKPPAEYDVTVELSRQQAGKAFVLGLKGTRQFCVLLDDGDKSASGLSLVDGKPLMLSTASVIPVDKVVQITCQVRKQQIRLIADGKPVFEWKGDLDRLSLPSDWETPSRNTLFVGCENASFLIHKLTLTPIGESVVTKPKPSEPMPEPVVRPSRTIDLLDLIDLRGMPNWTMRNGEFVWISSNDRLWPKMQLPYDMLGQEYDLELEVVPVTANRTLYIGLAGPNRFAVVIDGFRGSVSGISRIDDEVYYRSQHSYKGQVLTQGEPARIVCKVRKNRVTVICNDKQIVDWEGDLKRLSMRELYRDFNYQGLWLVSMESRHKIRKIQVTLVDTVEVSERLDVPDEKTEKATAELIRDVYKELFEVKTAAERRSLPGKLLREAIVSKTGTAEDIAGKYVLFKMAYDSAVELGDAVTAFAAADRLAERFKTDALQMKLAALPKLLKAATPQQSLFAVNAISPARAQALSANDYETAKEFDKLALAAAKKTRSQALVQNVITRSKETRTIEEEYAKLKDSFETLKKDPDHPDANLAVGAFVCFFQNNWDKGLAMLRKGSDAALKKLAEQEFNRPKKFDERVALGDGWWELSEKKSGIARLNIQERAVFWYKRALPELAGLTKARIERNLATQLATAIKAGRRRIHPTLGYELKQHPRGAIQFNGHWYSFVPIKASWQEANLFCQRQGGYLVSIESAAENQFIEKLKKDNSIWLGGYRDATGEWMWLSGNKFGYTAWQRRPRDSGNAVLRMREEEWELVPLNEQQKYAFICEWEY